MKKIFIIIVSVTILTVGVYYLASANSSANVEKTTDIAVPQNGYSSGQTNNSKIQPLLGQSPSTRTRAS